MVGRDSGARVFTLDATEPFISVRLVASPAGVFPALLSLPVEVTNNTDAEVEVTFHRGDMLKRNGVTHFIVGADYTLKLAPLARLNVEIGVLKFGSKRVRKFQRKRPQAAEQAAALVAAAARALAVQ